MILFGFCSYFFKNPQNYSSICVKPTCAISLVRIAGSHSDVQQCNESQAVKLNLICVSLCILLLLFSVQRSISLKTKYEIYKTKLFWASETITRKKEAEKRNKPGLLVN